MSVATTQPNTAGHDSFLDIVSNIVGILVILVLVAGLRVKNAPVRTNQDTATRAQLEKAESRVAALHQDVLRLENQLEALRHQTDLRRAERDRLATLVKALEHELKTARQKLDHRETKRLDLHAQLTEARRKLRTLQDELQQSHQAQPVPTLIENYPTPLSKTVYGDEIHFRLRHGRIAFIPLEILIQQLKEEAQLKARQLLDRPELTDTVGPQGGFRLRYVLRRVDTSVDEQLTTGQIRIRLQQWTLIPASSDLGEPVDAALGPASRFRRVLSGYRPETTTVTIWVYPDSFSHFRRLKKELFHMGFATAGRPLPEGVPISGSPYGTRSAAQ
ncbi:MAG TPA: hypothetical protein EYP56_05770 [Planctomycetaceae bacterium]|nr:hypothetical protein [Planctomycetaceae bacterium]